MNILTTNKKLVKDHIYGFCLPYKETCPGMGECEHFCNWNNIHKRRGKKVNARHQRNFHLAESHFFAEMIVYELKNNPRMKYIRPNTVGDFYNQYYVDKWWAIANTCRDRFFYAYTKSFKCLDLSILEKLPNFKIIQSEGGKNKIDKRKPHAIIVEKGEPIPKGYHNASESDLVAVKHNKIALYRKGK